MDLFEYITIASSLLYSFAIMRLISALPYVFRSGHAYWVQYTFLITLIFWLVNAFWAAWSYNEASWTYLKFIVALSSPAAMYYLASVMVPTDPAEVGSWRDYYFSIRRRAFIGFTILALTTSLASTIIMGMPVVHPVRLADIGNLAFALAGLTFSSPRVHGILAILALISVLTVGGVLLAQPGALG